VKRTTILATIFSVFGFGASAEPLRMIPAPPGAMPAYEAVTITRSMGLDPLGSPVWRNGRYVVMATDDDGRELRVVLDAMSGQVIAVRPVAAQYYGAVYEPDGFDRPDRMPSAAPPRPTHVAPKAPRNAASSAKAVALVKPPVPDEKKVQQHEAPVQPVAAKSDVAAGNVALPAKKEIRKIEIDRKPEDQVPAQTPASAPKETPVNPLL
jgi:hypothetical protein